MHPYTPSKMARTNPLLRFNPLNVPQIVAGGAWIPGVGVSGLGTAGFAWTSITGSGDTFGQATVGSQPVATLGPSGQSIWRWDGTRSIRIPTPSAAIKFTGSGMYAGWFKLNLDDANFYTFFAHGDSPSDERMNIYKYNTPGQLQQFTTRDGTSANMCTAVRSGTNFAQWCYLEWPYDTAGALSDLRCQFWVNRVNQSNSFTTGSAPASLFATTAVFDYAHDNGTLPWNGDTGPFYITNGLVSDSTRDMMMNYRRPV